MGKANPASYAIRSARIRRGEVINLVRYRLTPHGWRTDLVRGQYIDITDHYYRALVDGELCAYPIRSWDLCVL